MYDQKYQKSSKTFPLRYLPVSSRFAKARSAPWLCQRTDFMHARHTFICGRGFSHTRICSATSCDVFARVVWIKPWGEMDLTFLLYSFVALACHAVLPATQSRMRKELKRGSPSSFCPFRTFRTGEKYPLPIVPFQTSEKYMMLFCYFPDKRKVPLTYYYFSKK